MATENSAVSSLPSMRRYIQVQGILTKDIALRELLGPCDKEVSRRTGEVQKFPRGVVLVTEYLHANKLDTGPLTQHDVIMNAIKVLNYTPGSPVGQPKVPVPEKVVTKAPKAKAPAAPKTEVTKAPQVAVKVQPVKTAAVPPKKTRRATSPVKPAAPATKVQVAKTPVPVQDGTLSVPATATGSTQTVPAVFIFQTVLASVAAVHSVLQDFDRAPGAEGRLATVEGLINDLVKLKDIPVPLPLDKLQFPLPHDKATTTVTAKA